MASVTKKELLRGNIRDITIESIESSAKADIDKLLLTDEDAIKTSSIINPIPTHESHDDDYNIDLRDKDSDGK